MRMPASDTIERHDMATQGPERQLWCAVLHRALQDATDRIATVSGEDERMRIREEARNWFLRNGYDFRIACEAAGFDPDYLRCVVLPLIERDGAKS